MSRPARQTLRGLLATPQGLLDGRLTLAADGRIAAVEGRPATAAARQDPGLPRILPGFIDLHVHGGGGRDVMEGAEATRTVAEVHARHGTTALLATTMTAPPGALEQTFVDLAAGLGDDPGQGARILGVHLEGPYIDPGRLGAQPDFARPFGAEELARLHARVPIRLITLAPEVPGNQAAIAALCAAGHVVQIGHSNGSYEDGVAALAAGARGFTHLFNAMSGLHHRSPGMVGAALAHARHAEIIPDLLHVHPGALRAALRAIPGLYCVTDATAAAGMPDGEYPLGHHRVIRCQGGVRLADGTLAGSVLTMDQALRNLVFALGLALEDAACRVSTFAADFIGLSDRGRLRPGAWADLVVLDHSLVPQQVWVEGRCVMPAPVAPA